jgi:signal peptidase
MEITLGARARRPRGRSRLVDALCVFVILASLALLVPSFLGLQRHVVRDNPMDGTYGQGTLLYAETVPVSALRVGDVITFAPPAGTDLANDVTRRIVAIDGAGVRTGGDAAGDTDPWTLRLTGDQQRVRYAVPGAGYLMLGLDDGPTRIALIGVPAAIIALVSAAELHRRRSRRGTSSFAVAPTESAAGTGPGVPAQRRYRAESPRTGV